MSGPISADYIRTETSVLPDGLMTCKAVSGDAKAFMAFLGRHLKPNVGAYRIEGLPSQKTLGERYFGWTRQKTNAVIGELRRAGWLAVSKDGWPSRPSYLIRRPQMAFVFGKKEREASEPVDAMVGHSVVAMVGQLYNYSLSTSNPVVISNYDDEGRTDEVVVARLKNYGVTDGQIHTLRRLGRSLDVARIECEVAWIRAGKRSSEKVRAESAMLYTALRDNLPPPADVAWEQARAQRLELEHDELARRRAREAAIRTPEAIAASRPAIEAAKARLRKGMA